MSTTAVQPAPVPPEAIAVPRRRPSAWVIPVRAILFAVLGFAYGAGLRAWMRLVSDDPEFTWSGTIFIVGAFTIGFGACGLVSGAGARGWKGLLIPLRVVALVLSLACFAGAGAVMLPTIVFGSLAFARTDWPMWLRRVFGVLTLLTTFVLFTDGAGELGWTRLLVGYVLYLGFVCFEIRFLSEPYRPSIGRLPLALKIVASAGAIFLVLAVVSMMVGIATGDA